MTNYRFFLILTCMICLFYISCEKTGLQITSNSDNKPIQTRGDCEECPGVNECCCAVWLEAPDQSASLRFCGTSDGASACTGSNICGSSFSGGGQQIVLDNNNPGQLFCMGEGNPFYIYNFHPTDQASINVTCEDDLTNPTIIQLRISPGDTVYFAANGSCVIDSCQ